MPRPATSRSRYEPASRGNVAKRRAERLTATVATAVAALLFITVPAFSQEARVGLPTDDAGADDIAQATELPVAETQTFGRIDVPGDKDVYRLDLASPTGVIHPRIVRWIAIELMNDTCVADPLAATVLNHEGKPMRWLRAHPRRYFTDRVSGEVLVPTPSYFLLLERDRPAYLVLENRFDPTCSGTTYGVAHLRLDLRTPCERLASGDLTASRAQGPIARSCQVNTGVRSIYCGPASREVEQLADRLKRKRIGLRGASGSARDVLRRQVRHLTDDWRAAKKKAKKYCGG